MMMVFLILSYQLEIYCVLSFAGALAYQIHAKHIITGVCETDFSGYPDCRDSFIKSMNVTLSLSMDKDFVIHTPLMWLEHRHGHSAIARCVRLYSPQHINML